LLARWQRRARPDWPALSPARTDSWKEPNVDSWSPAQKIEFCWAPDVPARLKIDESDEEVITLT